ncbi:hypothetical protein AMJ80_01950, partial [bacterium SM23_31]
LFKTVDQGNNWKAISPDLTANPDERSSAIVSVCESPVEPGVVWAGTNDGNVYLTKDDGVNWTLLNANITGAPQFYWVKRIEASHHAAGRAYIALDGHRYEDWAPYIYVTEDFGATWKNISNNLPEGSIYVVREDLKNPDLLFAGSEFSLHYSLDRGMTWSRFMTGFPTVPVHDLVIHPRDGDLIAATHGRGAWIADNITPLQQLTADVKEEDVHLFDVRPEVQWERTYEWTWVPEKRFYKPNPPTGSTIAYYLRRDIPDSVTIEILDITGEVIWNFDGPPTAGISKVFWNFRKNPPPRTDMQPGQFGQQMRGRGGRSASPAEPGEYLVRLTAGGTILTTKLIIEKDNPGNLGK